MNEQTIIQIIQLATAAAAVAEKAIADFHAQSGMNEDQLLEFAEKQDADVRSHVQAFVAKLQAKKAS